MKITVVAHGSRGDVQPPLLLAHRLATRGHEVCFAGPSDFVPIARQLGCRVVAMPLDARAEVTSTALRRELLAGRTLPFFAEAFAREGARLPATLHALLDASEGAELIVAPATMEDLCITAAEARRQRVAFAFPMPVWHNDTYPCFLFSHWPVPRMLNRLSYDLAELGARRSVPWVNGCRVALGLRAARRRLSLTFRELAPPVFYWVPPEVMPRPTGFGDHHLFSGYWAMTPAARRAFGEGPPAPAVERFLAGGDAIYVGFGSMPVLGPAVLDAVRGAARALGVRVLCATGWSERGTAVDADLLFVDAIDHDWAFARCVAAVHHGGTGTTGAALRAGTPSVIAAVFADQPFWGRRVRELGVGETLRFQRLDETRLRRAIERVLRPATRARARTLALELAARPDATEEVARFVEERGASIPIPPRL